MSRLSKMRILTSVAFKRVKNIIINLFCILFLFGSILAYAKEYDLKALQKEAIKNNYQVSTLKNKIEIEIFKEELESLEKNLPKMGLTVGYVHRSKRLSSSPDEIAYLYLNYNIFNGFKDKYSQEIINLNIKKQRMGLSFEIKRIKKEVEKKYYKILSLANKIKIEKIHIKEVKKKSLLAEKLFAAGTLSKSDFLAIEILSADLKSNLQELIQNQSQVKIELANKIGLQNNSSISLTGSIPNIYLTSDINQKKLLEKLRVKNNSMKLSEIDRAMSQKRILLAKYKWLPKIDIESKYGRLAEDYEEHNDPKNEVSILLTFDFFSGLQSYWDRKKRLLELDIADNDLNLMFNDLRFQLKKKIISMESLQSKMDLIVSQSIRIEKFYESLEIEYKKGIKSLGELSEASEKLFESLHRKEDIKLQMLNLKLDIELLTGENIENYKLAKEVDND